MIAGTAKRLGAILALGSLLTMAASCSDDDDDATDSSDPTVPTASTGSTTATTTETTEAPTSTEPAPTTTELNPVPTTPAPPSTTSTTAELPPVATLVPQVPDELLTPEQRDPFNVNNSRPILPEHVPVLEAHLQALQASTLVSSNSPVNADAPELLEAPLTPPILLRVQAALRDRLARGEVLNVSQGVTFRPFVIGSVTDTATVFDCELAGHYWVNSQTGEVVPPDEVWPAAPGRIVEVGLVQTMVLRDGRWLVDTSEIAPGVCE